jgi:hypothetical protein
MHSIFYNPHLCMVQAGKVFGQLTDPLIIFHHPPHLQVTQDMIDRVRTTSLNHNTIIYDFKMENFYLHESRNGFDILQMKKPVRLASGPGNILHFLQSLPLCGAGWKNLWMANIPSHYLSYGAVCFAQFDMLLYSKPPLVLQLK